MSSSSTNIYIELGKKKVFVGAVDWPGWTRSGRDESSAIQTFMEYGPRYVQALTSSELDLTLPTNTFDLEIISRYRGNSTIDFGAPAIILHEDREPINAEEFEKLCSILSACWKAFDQAIDHANGNALRKGPRGGGRDLEKIMDHVLEGDKAYLRRIAQKLDLKDGMLTSQKLIHTQETILNALECAQKKGLPERGPRGGLIWPPRYFILRVAWHVLDHAWEIEDRLQ